MFKPLLDEKLNRSANFLKLSGDLLSDFPKLSETDLYRVASGTYQFKRSKSYYAEHLNENKGRFEIQVCKYIGQFHLHSYGIACDDLMLIRGRIHSRFRNQTKYLLYILIDRVKIGTESIVEYCCHCKSRQRTVGTCAHIMTVLWYLDYGRHLAEIKAPAALLEEFYAGVLPDRTDEDTESN